MGNVAAYALVVVLAIAVVLVALRRRSQERERSQHPISEAQALLAYGRHREAEAILKQYLAANPGDPEATALLFRARH
jgi:predicted Zn-dependent protease